MVLPWTHPMCIASVKTATVHRSRRRSPRFPILNFFLLLILFHSLHLNSNNSLTRAKINWYKLSFHFFRTNPQQFRNFQADIFLIQFSQKLLFILQKHTRQYFLTIVVHESIKHKAENDLLARHFNKYEVMMLFWLARYSVFISKLCFLNLDHDVSFDDDSFLLNVMTLDDIIQTL